jgi:hypothetical protein
VRRARARQLLDGLEPDGRGQHFRERRAVPEQDGDEMDRQLIDQARAQVLVGCESSYVRRPQITAPVPATPLVSTSRPVASSVMSNTNLLVRPSVPAVGTRLNTNPSPL